MTIWPPGLPERLLIYLARGWAIFAVRGKVPLTPNGFKDASTDPQQWLVWLREFPSCGWAAPTGEVNGFDVLDADTPEDVEELEERLPTGPRVRTGGGGMHFYLRHEPGARNWAKRLPGCDFRGDGGYSVLAGSIHQNGQLYTWVEGTADLPLPDTPSWLAKLQEPTSSRVSSRVRYVRGERNDRLFRLACAVREKGRDVLEEVRRANEELCSPPLGDTEVQRIVASALRYPSKGLGPIRCEPPPLFLADGSPDRAAFVLTAMTHFPLAALQDSEELLIYRDGQYVTGAEPILKGWIEAQFRERGETAYSSFVNETIAAIGRRTYVPRKEFNPAGLVCLANGVLDLTNPVQPVLRAHDPGVRFTAKIQVAYDPSATCPAFGRFLIEVLPQEADRTEVRKLFGYCLMPGNPLQIAFMFIGEGANGKSTLLSVLVAMVGEDNVTAETLQSLVTNRFAPAKLWGKRANICADIPANPLPFTGVLKILTGGDLTRAENKFGHPFYFVNDAKLVFSANELPQVTDRTHAFWRRWFMIRLTETFTGREDRHLVEKLKAELPGILNFALLGLADLAEDGEFKPTRTSEQLALEWRQRADPVYWFVSAQVDKVPGAWFSKEDLYEGYVQFCETHGCSPRRPEVFGKLLPNHAPWVRTERRNVGGRAVRGWLGLRLRPEAEEDHPGYPAPPVTSHPDLTGWAGKAGSLTSAPGEPDALVDPGDLFDGGQTRADRARRPSSDDAGGGGSP